jgi:hypothetical protein
MKKVKQAVMPILKQSMENWNRQCFGWKSSNKYLFRRTSGISGIVGVKDSG